MKKIIGIIIITLTTLFWVSMLSYITFYPINTYWNTLIFFFGAMLTICGFSYGCEKMGR